MRFQLQMIPTNLISGFLGAGKTTAIRHLLRQKPAEERWAVLVNEFGDVGVDDALIHADNNVYLSQLAGGCMCCVTGAALPATLNKLLREAKPDRLLIEPTGLGHPRQLLSLLHAGHYKNVLDIRATLTLVDARQMLSRRHTENETFNQQLEVADMIIANKADLYRTNELQRLCQYIAEKPWFNGQEIVSVEQASIPLTWLDKPRENALAVETSISLSLLNTVDMANESVKSLAATERAYKQNRGDGFIAYSWRWGSAFVFSHQRLQQLLSARHIERVKAICLTDNGVMQYQYAAGVFDVQPHTGLDDSRITLIFAEKNAADFSEALQQCLL